MAKRVNKDLNIRISQTGGKKTEKEIGGIESSIRSMVVAGLSIAGVKKVLDNTTGAAIKQEEIFRKLQKTVEINGKVWSDVKGQLDGTFASLQGLTKYGDTQSADMLQTMIQLSSDYEGSLEALPIAMDFASSGLVNMETSSKLMGMALAGNVEMLGRYVPELKTTNNAQLKTMTSAEKAAFAVETLRQKFGGMAESELEATSGKLQAVENYLGDIGETIGDSTLPAMNGLLDTTIDFLQQLSETTLQTAVRQLQELGVAAEDLKELQLGVSIENDMQKIIDIQDEVADMFNNVSKSFRSVDIAREITGLESLREIQSSNLAITDLNTEAIQDNIDKIKAQAKAIIDGGVDNTKEKTGTLLLLGKEEVALTKLLTLINTYNRTYDNLGKTNEGLSGSIDAVKMSIDGLSIKADPEKHMEPLVRTVQNGIKPFEMFSDNIEGTNGEVVRLTKTQDYYDESLTTVNDETAKAILLQGQYAESFNITTYYTNLATDALLTLDSLLDKENAKISDYLLSIGGILGSIPGFEGLGAGLQFGGAFGRLLGFADGGQPPVGQPSVVGERGPEIFVPNVAGTIIPNEQIGGVTIIVQGDFLGTEQQADKMAHIIAERSNQGFNGIALKQ